MFTFCLTALSCAFLNVIVVIFNSSLIADVSVYTAAASMTSTKENVGAGPMLDVAGSSQPETSEGLDDLFYELYDLNSA